MYIVGDTAGTFPGQTKVPGGLYDAFLIKYDPSGNQKWVREFGTQYEDYALAVAVTAGSVVVGAHLEDSLTSVPWPGAVGLLFFDFDGNLQPPRRSNSVMASTTTPTVSRPT